MLQNPRRLGPPPRRWLGATGYHRHGLHHPTRAYTVVLL